MAKISQLPVIVKNDLYNPFISLVESQPKSIDSLKLRISIDNVKIINEVLGDEYFVFSKRTGEEITDENFKRNAYFHEEKGCKTFYKIENQITKDGIVLPYLTILFTSKILGVDYFKGIQRTTVFEVYEQIIKQQVVYMTFEDFMFGECTDTDVKIDLIPRVEATEIINTIYSLAKPKKLAIEACSIYRRKTNLGIQFALRKTSKYINCPYLKFYEKIRELNSKSEEFYHNHLSGLNLPKEILRVETTIKNKKHFKHFGQENTTLDSVTNNLDNIAILAFKKAFNAHLEFSEKALSSKNLLAKESKTNKLTLNERIIYNSIKKNMEIGFNFTDACMALIDDCSNSKFDKYHLKKKISKIFKIVSVPKVGKTNVCLSTFKAVMEMIDSNSVPVSFRA